ncbi:MAG TPA: HAD-IB family hydrolase, partial [Kineosporiaceae bacterium]|nr:HAD-IB family hydrolase [Kineosporiaceae bacterium]
AAGLPLSDPIPGAQAGPVTAPIGPDGVADGLPPLPVHPRVTVHPVDDRMRGGAAAAEVEAALAVPADTGAAAFFDVDNTVMRGASIFHLARGLYRRRFFTLRDIGRFAWEQARFLAVGENLEHVEQVQARALSFVAGHSVAELRSVGEEIFDEIMADKIWPGTHALARMHLDAGQRVWLVTATPVEVAEVIAERLGLTGALGTVAEHVDGVYTGRLVGQPMHGAAKAEAVRALAELEGLDLTRCAAYSDSANDIPLLSLVGHPCAINPDARLRRRAHAEGWRIRDYRTGRKAARIGIPTAMALGAVAGAIAGATAVNRRRRP